MSPKGSSTRRSMPTNQLCLKEAFKAREEPSHRSTEAWRRTLLFTRLLSGADLSPRAPRLRTARGPTHRWQPNFLILPALLTDGGSSYPGWTATRRRVN